MMKTMWEATKRIDTAENTFKHIVAGIVEKFLNFKDKGEKKQGKYK